MAIRRLACLVFLSTMLTCFVAHHASAQQSAPTETKGVTIIKTDVIELGPEIEGMQGRQLRTRVMSLEPGGAIALHKQLDRPETVYMISGTITEYRNGTAIQRNTGDTLTAGKDITHAVQNTGTIPAVFVVTDVFKAQ
jgi:quercetin dioxygenase-like cupin family protein